MEIEITAQQMGFAEGCEIVVGGREDFYACDRAGCEFPPFLVRKENWRLGLTVDGLLVIHSKRLPSPGDEEPYWGVKWLERIGKFSACLAFPGKTHEVWKWASLRTPPLTAEDE